MAIATGRETEPSGNPDRPGRGNTAGSEQDAGGGTTVRKDKLKSRHITMITLGGIMGSALFIGSGNVIAKAGPAAVMSYAIGGVLVFLAMVLLGEMAARRPAVGSFMEYSRINIGDGAAYIVGWLYWYFWVGVLAYDAVVGGAILHGWFPFLDEWAWGLLMLGLFIAINLRSVKTFGEVEFWLASIKVVAVIIFLVVGAMLAFGLWPGDDGGARFSNLTDHGGLAPNGMGSVVSGVAIVIFAYFGTEVAVMAAAESENPGKGIRQATKTVIWRILLFFVGSVAIIVTVIPWDSLPAATDAASGPFAAVIGELGVPGASMIMELVVFAAVLSVMNAGLYAASRMLSSMAEQKYAPEITAKRNAKGVPVVAVVLSTIGGVVGCLVNFLFPDVGLFDFIMSSTGLVALFVYAFIALSNWNMRRKMTPEETAAVATKLRVPLFPLSNIIVLVGVAAVVVVMLIDGSTAEVWSSVVATAFIGVLWPVVKRRKRAAEKEAAA
ncbi:amino acid permease [Corynebacterium variabile]|uniref:amino acid permease n=1 Tax=Corynebacterium variabile TaxID=1727 RepID=UPI003FD3F41D